jgi:transposase-like protein
MRPTLTQLIHEIEAKKVFKRNRKDVRLKILATLLYFFGLSLRKTSRFISVFQEMSYESVRTYYHRLKEVIKPPEKRIEGL